VRSLWRAARPRRRALPSPWSFAGCGAAVTNAHYAGSLGAVGVSLRVHPHPHFAPRDVAAYIAAQCAGAIAAALALLAVWTDKPAQLGATVPSVSAGSAAV
jgi:glycerol uptake facilitator-like aquaporin